MAAVPAIPDDLLCTLCKQLSEDAVMLPCCALNACEPCAREAFTRLGKCPLPACGADDVTGDDVIPNRRVRTKAGEFRNRYRVPLPDRTPKKEEVAAKPAEDAEKGKRLRERWRMLKNVFWLLMCLRRDFEKQRKIECHHANVLLFQLF